MSLRTLALVSGLYDLALAAPLLFAAEAMARAFGAPAPQPVVNAQLNGVFTLSLGVGYLWAAQDAAARRGYLWVAGVLAKGWAPRSSSSTTTRGAPPRPSCCSRPPTAPWPC